MTIRQIFLTLSLLAASLLLTACPKTSQKLAVASDVVSHGLANADNAATQAVAYGSIPQADRDAFHAVLVRAAGAGLILDQGIRANEAATTLSAKVNSFLDAFNALNTSGLAGIKDPNTKLAISTILTGAETSVAIIAATVGK